MLNYLKFWISFILIWISPLLLAQGETCETAIETEFLVNKVKNIASGGPSNNQCYSEASNSIWFVHEAFVGEEMVIRTNCESLLSNPNARLAIYKGQCGDLECIATSDSTNGSIESSVYFTAQSNTTYFFEWNNYLGSGDFLFLFQGFGIDLNCQDMCFLFQDGDSCDDGDPNTINDVIDAAQCSCSGELTDSPDCPNLGLNIGDDCDDGDPLTMDEQVDIFCNCTTPDDCPTDWDGNGITNGSDLSYFLGAYGVDCIPNTACPTDYDGNGFTGGTDWGLFLGNFGIPCTTDASISLLKTNYPQYKIFQRNSTDHYDFALSGTYTGTCTAVEASFDGNSYVTIDNSPTGGVFSGTLVDQGVGQGRLTVRCSNEILASDAVDDIGIGDVYVVAGQSNAEGNGLIPQLYTTVAPTASVFPTVYTQTDTWKVGNDDTDPGGGLGSAWPILGGYIAENTGVPVNFITTASGGTNLNTQWQPGNPIYNSYVNQVAEANVNGVKAVLWFQGESDVDDAVSRSQYNALLDQLIINFQSDAPGTPDLVPGIIGSRLGNINQVNTTKIRLATQDAWDDNASILHGPQTYDIHITLDGEGDNIHFGTNEEIQTLAFRWWKALEEHYYSGSEGRGPQVSAAQMGAGNMTMDIDFIASSALQGGTSTCMWFVDDNGTDRAVTEASLVDSNTLRLTLAQATTSTNIKLTYAKGNSGENQDVLTDSTTGNTAAGTSPLPADGFSDFVVIPAP